MTSKLPRKLSSFYIFQNNIVIIIRLEHTYNWSITLIHTSFFQFLFLLLFPSVFTLTHVMHVIKVYNIRYQYRRVWRCQSPPIWTQLSWDSPLRQEFVVFQDLDCVKRCFMTQVLCEVAIKKMFLTGGWSLFEWSPWKILINSLRGQRLLCWTNEILPECAAGCAVQYNSISTLISHTLLALPAPEDWWQSCIICIDYYCLWISEGQTEQTSSEPRDAVVMGTLSCCRATERKLNFSVIRSAYVMPVKASARFALPRRNFIFFSPPLYFSRCCSLSLFLFSLLSHVYPVGHCCHGNVAVRLYRMWLELRRGERCLFVEKKKLEWMKSFSGWMQTVIFVLS